MPEQGKALPKSGRDPLKTVGSSLLWLRCIGSSLLRLRPGPGLLFAPAQVLAQGGSQPFGLQHLLAPGFFGHDGGYAGLGHGALKGALLGRARPGRKKWLDRGHNRRQDVIKRILWEEIMDRRLFLGSALACASLPAVAQQGAWTVLLDGKSLDGWKRTGDANWRIEDGSAVADKGNGYLVTPDIYEDFEIRAEFWVDPDANSGVFIRCEEPANPSSKTGYEVNIFDKRPEAAYGTGAIVGVAKVEPMPKAGGRWNVMEVSARGPIFTVTLNGTRTVDGASDSMHARGAIALQYGSGIVKFRKVEVRRL